MPRSVEPNRERKCIRTRRAVSRSVRSFPMTYSSIRSSTMFQMGNPFGYSVLSRSKTKSGVVIRSVYSPLSLERTAIKDVRIPRIM